MAYEKDEAFIVRQAEPFNAGPPLDRLVAHQQTPNNLFFARNHGNVPKVDPAAYRLKVTGKVNTELTLDLQALQSNFKPVTLEATLQCAGNRRAEMAAYKPIPAELPWGAEAISNARWTGIRLSDLLLLAGVSAAAGDLHVEFSGLDDVERHGHQFNFGGSIPVEKAFNQEVILAYQMNDMPLPPVHGFPLRMVVPGYIGARSVKWLREIRVRSGPSENYFQAKAYRLFPPQVNADNVVWEQGLMLGQMQLNSVICLPEPQARVLAGSVELRGYAIAGGARQIARVDVSADGGRSWQQAELLGSARPWAWRLWRAVCTLAPGRHELVVRAVDTATNMQPASMQQIWNFKGYAANGWHRQTLTVE